MFSTAQKRAIADAVQKILRDTAHPELPEGEIQFSLHVCGQEIWSQADIRNNGAVTEPRINLWNEAVQMMTPKEFEKNAAILTAATKRPLDNS